MSIEELEEIYAYLNDFENYIPEHIDRKQALNTLEAIIWAKKNLA